MNDPRVDKLPSWARAIIDDLQDRLESRADPLAKELATLRPKVELLQRRCEAYQELLEAAALGKHQSASEIVNVLAGYSLELVKEE